MNVLLFPEGMSPVTPPPPHPLEAPTAICIHGLAHSDNPRYIIMLFLTNAPETACLQKSNFISVTPNVIELLRLVLLFAYNNKHVKNFLDCHLKRICVLRRTPRYSECSVFSFGFEYIQISHPITVSQSMASFEWTKCFP